MASRLRWRMQDHRARLHCCGRAPSLPGRAEEDEGRVASIDVQGDGPAPAGTNDHIGPMPVELGLGDADGGVEVVVRQGRVQDLMAVVLQVGRLHAAWGRLPAVEEKNSHAIH